MDDTVDTVDTAPNEASSPPAQPMTNDKIVLEEGVFAYEIEDQEIPESIKSTMTKLIVRGPVNAIGKEAFKECASLKEIEFSDATALETIGESAFFQCTYLAAFKCPSNVNTIGYQAFTECTSLKEIDFSDATALETIEEKAFWKCTSLASAFKCPSNVKTIGKQAFMECKPKGS